MTVFPEAEFENRLARAQAAMGKAGFDALLLTSEADVRYFTGYLTRFWESPSRPWFLVIPASGKPVAVIPAIGGALMAKTWIDDIRTWPAPTPGDDGVTLLAECLREIGTERIAMPMGYETQLRMPLQDFHRVQDLIAPMRIDADGGLVALLRAIKSQAEVALIETACGIAGRAFDRVGEIAGRGTPLSDVFRNFQRLCLEEGADWVPYLAGGAGSLGYDDVISPATPRPLQSGDVLMLDTGLVHQGYFCDYDRNFVVGRPDPAVAAGYQRLREATQAGQEAARPGATAAEVYQAMQNICQAGPGRLGHGLGMQLTEGLSLIAEDHTVLEPGMVITLEPGVDIPGGGILVHEDDFVIEENGARQLSPTAPSNLPELPA
ncbi:M24 family metallopeptidase [Thalassococcus lentus]|uniref:Xaa-Pro peptidase family protein n=1 Tax=Thalassococcus lentus TaxID=1210524 RepID=A0ABT4XXJ5_9RHOB|nr:Xaa-Pro peptidase family protein [Thalassococcus lentus]MDA7426669.1 Xaa-Pro peptidase family protein [Thalassococcus lentus]